MHLKLEKILQKEVTDEIHNSMQQQAHHTWHSEPQHAKVSFRAEQNWKLNL